MKRARKTRAPRKTVPAATTETPNSGDMNIVLPFATLMMTSEAASIEKKRTRNDPRDLVFTFLQDHDPAALGISLQKLYIVFCEWYARRPGVKEYKLQPVPFSTFKRCEREFRKRRQAR